MYTEADLALYQAKQKGKNQYKVYEESERLKKKTIKTSLTKRINLHELLNKIDAGVIIYQIQEQTLKTHI